jgi:peptide-methionine (S)-S-oxide reductase
MGGHVSNPTYDEICKGETGHAETIKVEYDPTLISTEELLEVFFDSHDPTSVDRQGADIGSQYRSAIFYTEHTQKDSAEKIMQRLTESGKKVVTELELAPEFYPAEKDHHNYYSKNPEKMYCQIVISPKLEKLKKNHKELLA